MKLLVLTLSLLASTAMINTAAAADEASATMAATAIQGSNADSPSGFLPFVGLGVGYTGANDTLQTEGTPSQIKLLGSYYFAAPVVADFGIGLMNHNFTQYEGTKSSISGEVYEAAARYKFANRWQAGAVVNAFAGAADRFGSSETNAATFVGLQAVKEFTIAKEFVLRAGARLMTDIGIQNEMVNVGMIDVALGWAPTKMSTSAPVAEAVAPAAVVPVAAAVTTFEVKNQKLGGFKIGKTEMAKSNTAYLNALSKTLAENANLFAKVEVVGHADKTGQYATNQTISGMRAEKVAAALMKSGMAKEKIETLAKADTEPLIDSLQPAAMKQNRRVELKFYGVKDQAALEKILSAIK